MEPLLSCIVLFSEPGFPLADMPALLAGARLQGAIDTRDTTELSAALTQERVLLWRHGSTFPTDLWPVLCRHLQAGGSMLHIGGEPFTREATGKSGERRIQQRSIALLRALQLNQCYRLDVGGAELDISPASRMGLGAGAADQPTKRTLPNGAWTSILEPRLTNGKDYADEDGSPGPRDAVVHTLALLRQPTEDGRFPAAAAAICIDHLGGKWAGGRWVFWLCSEPPNDQELAMLVRVASERPAQIRLDPSLGCFHAGEKPSLRLSMHSPKPKTKTTMVELSVATPDGRKRELRVESVPSSPKPPITVQIPGDAGPGLYRVVAHAPGIPEATTGYWVMDRPLFCSGDSLTFDSDTLRRNGKPMPVVGTTLMSSTVHRHFLFEPNAAAWDDAFAELASLNINLVRTGIWSGWRRICEKPGSVDEAWLRALEAYYLSARKHGIPIIFTFFAFTPHAFGGDNPYFDPAAINGQRAYVRAVAERFADAREMMWDLINEPSFSSPKQLWKCRPHGDKHEAAAFADWLRREHGAEWESQVRQRWQLPPDEPVGLPTLEDFDDRAVFESRRPMRAADYMRFAQAAYADWSMHMRGAIRDGGSQAAITTGQDEGGLTTRPSPLFHYSTVEFTSMHTWWSNDALLWDGLLARAAGKPLLISETGIMQRELLTGEAIRGPRTFADQLARKIGYSFAAGAFGVVQWCYDVNPYMASDNEVAIGLRRVDGSYKPEHRVLREAAAFVARNSERFESPRPPEVVLVLPAGDVFSPRDEATRATRRLARLLCFEWGLTPLVIPDDRLAADLPSGIKAIIVPSNRGLSESGWQAVLAAGRKGAIIICSGWFETNEVGMPAKRIGVERRALHQAEPMAPPAPGVAPGIAPGIARFPAATTESWFAAARAAGSHELTVDAARVIHDPLPIDWAESDDPARTFYAAALKRAGLAAWPHAQAAWSKGVNVRRVAFSHAILIIAMNESSHNVSIDVGGAAPLNVPAGGVNMSFMTADGAPFSDVLLKN